MSAKEAFFHLALQLDFPPLTGGDRTQALYAPRLSAKATRRLLDSYSALPAEAKIADDITVVSFRLNSVGQLSMVALPSVKARRRGVETPHTVARSNSAGWRAYVQPACR